MTQSKNSPRVVSSAAELVQDVTVDLVGITYYRVSAELDDGLSSDDSDMGELVPTYGLKLLSDGDEIGVRLSLTLKGDIGRVEVDIAANYTTPFPIELTEDVRLSFANEVGIMTLIPYVRETVWALTQRVFGTAIVMPVLQRGELSFTRDGSDGTNKLASADN